jgi:hypothetical protein
MTALQQLYEEIESVEKNSNNGLVSIIDLKRAIGNYYLGKEKQQIIDALHYFGIERAGEYYEQTYNQTNQ